MITRSLCRPPGRSSNATAGERRGPIAGPRPKDAFPRRGGARRPDPATAGHKRRGQTRSNNYWSSTSIAANPNNAWIVEYNNGNMNNDNKTNSYYVRAVRGGS